VIYHAFLSVRGALTNWPKRMFKNMFKHDDGRTMTADEAKSTLLDELSKGHEVIPYGDCDNFDFKKGCQGHPDKTDEGAR
jgi:hypothetical protein